MSHSQWLEVIINQRNITKHESLAGRIKVIPNLINKQQFALFLNHKTKLAILIAYGSLNIC